MVYDFGFDLKSTIRLFEYSAIFTGALFVLSACLLARISFYSGHVLRTLRELVDRLDVLEGMVPKPDPLEAIEETPDPDAAADSDPKSDPAGELRAWSKGAGIGEGRQRER